MKISVPVVYANGEPVRNSHNGISWYSAEDGTLTYSASERYEDMPLNKFIRILEEHSTIEICKTEKTTSGGEVEAWER